MNTRIHPTALVEQGAQIGSGTSIWDNVHIRHSAIIGEQCIVGGKSVIAGCVRIGNRVKINTNVYICSGVTIEDGVMVSASTIFTNDRFPRATTPDLTRLRPSEPDERTLPTLVREGATVGAGCLVGCGLTIGRFAMAGMGTVVTRCVPDFHLVIGSPARSTGCVCRCGRLLCRFTEATADRDNVACSDCGLQYAISDGMVRELTAAPELAK